MRIFTIIIIIIVIFTIITFIVITITIIISCDGSEMGEEDRETLSPDLRVRSGTTKRFGHNASQFWKILFLHIIWSRFSLKPQSRRASCVSMQDKVFKKCVCFSPGVTISPLYLYWNNFSLIGATISQRPSNRCDFPSPGSWTVKNATNLFVCLSWGWFLAFRMKKALLEVRLFKTTTNISNLGKAQEFNLMETSLAMENFNIERKKASCPNDAKKRKFYQENGRRQRSKSIFQPVNISDWKMT